MLKIELYTTDHCSLCEQALDMLLNMPDMAGVALVTVDIAATPELVELYGERIPVLKAADAELCAPFGRQDVLSFLQALTR